MKKAVLSEIWVIPFIMSIVMICYRPGFCGQWVRIDSPPFGEKGDVSRCFQEAVFDTNCLYVITSDSDDKMDPNRSTCLWVSNIPGDPNGLVSQDRPVWKEAGVFKEMAARADKLFNVAGFVYIGLYNEGKCRLYRLLDPNSKQPFSIDPGQNSLGKWRLDSGEAFGERLFLGIYEKDYGFKILALDLVDLSAMQVTQNGVDVEMQIADSNVLGAGLLEHVQEGLFAGTSETGPFARLYYYKHDDDEWRLFSGDDFIINDDSPNGLKDITAHICMAEFLESAWLLTESRGVDEKAYAIWVSETHSSEAYRWKVRFSSEDTEGPFADTNILALTGLCPVGEYLYLGCLFDNGGKIWKNYRGSEWILVPSSFLDPNNLLKGIFYNISDNNHIFAGTQNSNGAQILTRLVPRVDILGLSQQERFMGPVKKQGNPQIEIKFKCNWADPNYLQGLNRESEASVIYHQDLNGNYTYFRNPNRVAPYESSLWDFTPYMGEEGIYVIRWEFTYGQDQEKVLKYLFLAWDANAPSVPELSTAGVGDGSILLIWQSSRDNFENRVKFEDANFMNSLREYEMAYWASDDPAQDTNIVIPVNCSGYKIEGLKNYMSYKIHIRAKDKAGNVSEWSELVEATPKPTQGWTDLVGEKGGCFIFSLISGDKRMPVNGKRYFAGVKGGHYKPRSEEAKVIYGDDEVWPVQLELGWIHRSYLEVGLGAGYMEMDGVSLQADTLEKSIDPVTFRIIPCSMTLRWVPGWAQDKILAPYLGAGIDCWLYEEDKLKSENTDGLKFGYHGVFGLRLLLDRFDPRHARVMSENYGVIHTYLTLEAVYNWIDNFGDSRLDLSGPFLQAGILFLF